MTSLMIYVPNCNLLQHNYNKMTLSIFELFNITSDGSTFNT
jgi:hypothetical protein